MRRVFQMTGTITFFSPVWTFLGQNYVFTTSCLIFALIVNSRCVGSLVDVYINVPGTRSLTSRINPTTIGFNIRVILWTDLVLTSHLQFHHFLFWVQFVSSFFEFFSQLNQNVCWLIFQLSLVNKAENLFFILKE